MSRGDVPTDAGAPGSHARESEYLDLSRLTAGVHEPLHANAGFVGGEHRAEQLILAIETRGRVGRGRVDRGLRAGDGPTGRRGDSSGERVDEWAQLVGWQRPVHVAPRFCGGGV